MCPQLISICAMFLFLSNAFAITWPHEGTAPCAPKLATLPPLPKDCIDSLDKTAFSKNEIAVPKRVIDWGSNGRGGDPWQFTNPRCNDFFADLFSVIADQSSSMLTPHDLFHGHVIKYGKGDQSFVAIVFHAKEYPYDLEPNKNRYQAPRERFSTRDDTFIMRNYVYLGHDNALFRVFDDGECRDMFANVGVNTISENKIAKILPSGVLIGDVNFFLADKLSRIQYLFYKGFDPASGKFVRDLEGIQTGKSIGDRVYANIMIESLIEELAGRPLIYFLTGTKFNRSISI